MANKDNNINYSALKQNQITRRRITPNTSTNTTDMDSLFAKLYRYEHLFSDRFT